MTNQPNKPRHTPEPWLFEPSDSGDSSVGDFGHAASLYVEVDDAEGVDSLALEISQPTYVRYKVKSELLTEQERYFIDHPEQDVGDVPAGWREHGDIDANLARIAICVNFCAGKTDEEIEALGSLQNVLNEREGVQKKLEANPEGIARLKLALAINAGLVEALSAEDVKLLQLDFDVPSGIVPHPIIWQKVLKECVEIITAWHIEAMPVVVDVKLEYQKMAIALLRQIQSRGGLMTYKQLEAIPETIREELLNNMQIDMLIVRSMNGVKLGRNAQRALKEYGHLA